MTIVLDTDAASRLQKEALPDGHKELLDSEQLAISFVTVGEFYKGAYKAGWGPARLTKLDNWLARAPVLEYETAVGRAWGFISAEVERIGRPVLANDLWVAACCLAYDLPLMTFNRRDFEHIPDLRLLP